MESKTQAAFDFIVATLKGCEVKDLGLMIKATVPTPKFHELLEAIRFIEPHGIAMEMECKLPGKPSPSCSLLGTTGKTAGCCPPWALLTDTGSKCVYKPNKEREHGIPFDSDGKRQLR